MATTNGEQQFTYSGPHGSAESARLESQSAGIRCLLHGNTIQATLPTPPTKILDIGCGTGSLTFELARKFPSAECVGIDITPPDIAGRGNVRFLKGSFDGLVADGTLETELFDYIFSRMLIVGIVGWPAHTEKVFRLLRPGGVYEVQDLSWRTRDRDESVIYDQWPINTVVIETAKSKGLDMFCGENQPGYFKSGGFEDVRYTQYPWALQYWPEKPETKPIAHMMQTGMKGFGHSIVDKLLASSGKYSAEQLESFKEDLVNSLESYEEGTHNIFGVTTGRKPLSSS